MASAWSNAPGAGNSPDGVYGAWEKTVTNAHRHREEIEKLGVAEWAKVQADRARERVAKQLAERAPLSAEDARKEEVEESEQRMFRSRAGHTSAALQAGKAEPPSRRPTTPRGGRPRVWTRLPNFPGSMQSLRVTLESMDEALSSSPAPADATAQDRDEMRQMREIIKESLQELTLEEERPQRLPALDEAMGLKQ